jgi:hypothetical protein
VKEGNIFSGNARRIIICGGAENTEQIALVQESNISSNKA